VRSGPANGVLWPWVAVVVLWGCVFALACFLTQLDVFADLADDSVAERLLGAGRIAIGGSLYEMADIYFHQGVPFQQKKAFLDVFQICSEEIRPTPHVHTRHGRLREIVPALHFAMQMDPHNVDAYLVAAYWMGDQGGRPGFAKDILLEGLRHNPGDHRIYLEKARIHMITQEKEEAIKSLEAGLRSWPSNLDWADKQVQLDRLQLVSLRAFLYEVEGNVDKAREFYSMAAQMSPNNMSLRKRVVMLERGETRQEWARDTWEQLFARRVCARTDHDALPGEAEPQAHASGEDREGGHAHDEDHDH